jgi:hypothetical protein
MTVYDNSLKARVFALLEKNHELKSKDLCKLMDLQYAKDGHYVTILRSKWKYILKNRQGLKCLNFHNARAWIYCLKMVDRKAAVEGQGWLQTRAKNRMLLWRDKLGRIEWHEKGRLSLWIRKPATLGKAKQMLANAFFKTGLISDIQVFDLWASSVRFKGAHAVYDTGETLPYAKIEFLKESLGVVVKTGDLSHPTGIEIEFLYPDWAEKNELLFQQNIKSLDRFSSVLQDLGSRPQPQKPPDKEMVI